MDAFPKATSDADPTLLRRATMIMVKVNPEVAYAFRIPSTLLHTANFVEYYSYSYSGNVDYRLSVIGRNTSTNSPLVNFLNSSG